MEPITILELSSWAYDYLEKRGRVYLAVPPTIRFTPPTEIDLEACRISQVCITAEILSRNGVRHMMLFTHDEEPALLLKAAFLPGQLGTLREREREAMAKGFLQAFSMLGRE
jgi:hypothetical protein